LVCGWGVGGGGLVFLWVRVVSRAGLRLFGRGAGGFFWGGWGWVHCGGCWWGGYFFLFGGGAGGGFWGGAVFVGGGGFWGGFFGGGVGVVGGGGFLPCTYRRGPLFFRLAHLFPFPFLGIYGGVFSSSFCYFHRRDWLFPQTIRTFPFSSSFFLVPGGLASFSSFPGDAGEFPFLEQSHVLFAFPFHLLATLFLTEVL